MWLQPDGPGLSSGVNPLIRKVILLSCLAWGAGVPCWADADEAKAREILNRLTAFYRGLEAFEVESVMTTSMKNPQLVEPLTQELRQTYKVKRPGQFVLESRGDGMLFSAPNAYLDDWQGVLLLEGQGRIEAGGVATPAAFLRNPAFGFNPNAGGNIVFDQNIGLSFLNKLLFADVGQGWERDLKSVTLVGESVINDVKVDQLALTTETHQFGEAATMVLNIWVQQGKEPFLLRLKPDLSNLFSQGDGAPEMEVGMLGEWHSWNTKPSFKEDTFKAPKADDEMPVFPSFEAMMQAQTAAQNPALALTSTEAKAFTLKDLDGEEFQLSKHRGKEVVVLAFWGSWLSPEAEVLTALASIEKQLKDAPVEIVAVNVGEEEARVRAYLDEKKLGLRVVIDAEQKVAPLYEVRAVPQTVVIGKDGEIFQVHIGSDEAFEEELLRELRLILEAPAENTP